MDPETQNQKTVQEQVIDVIVEQLQVDREKVKPETRMKEDLQTDSLDVVEMVLGFEDKFKITIPEQDAENLATVSDIVAYVEQHLPKS